MSNVIDLPVQDPYSRAIEILADAPPDEFQATVATVLTGLCDKINLLQGQVFLLCSVVYGNRLTPPLRHELACMLDIDLDELAGGPA